MRKDTITKLVAQAAGERQIGNSILADAIDAKIASLQQNLAIPDAHQLNSVADARRWVEQQWEKIPPETLVTILTIEPGLSRAVRREMKMGDAIHLLKSGSARLVGRTADLVHVQATTENTAPISDTNNQQQLFI